jgi:hypothetical protein
MLGNEASILPAFINHAKTLFDSHSFVVHNASDGTFNHLKKEFSYSTVYLSQDGYPQSTVMTKLLLDAFNDGVDVVFPLDADEFLPFSNREELHNFLESKKDIDVLQIPWRNFSVRQFPLETDMNNLYFSHSYASVYKSVIFRSAYLKNSKISLTQGNHSVIPLDHLEIEKEKIKYIIHIPIRDQLHYAQKNIHGASTYLDENFHTLSDDWVKGALVPFPEEDLLISMALDYGERPCVEKHEVLNQISFFPWMRNGFDASSQRTSFLSVMREDWPKLKRMYSKSKDTELSEIEIKVLIQRIKKYEKSFSFRLLKRVERVAKSLLAFKGLSRNE